MTSGRDPRSRGLGSRTVALLVSSQLSRQFSLCVPISRFACAYAQGGSSSRHERLPARLLVEEAASPGLLPRCLRRESGRGRCGNQTYSEHPHSGTADSAIIDFPLGRGTVPSGTVTRARVPVACHRPALVRHPSSCRIRTGLGNEVSHRLRGHYPATPNWRCPATPILLIGTGILPGRWLVNDAAAIALRSIPHELWFATKPGSSVELRA